MSTILLAAILAQTVIYPAEMPLPDQELARERGGFRLPNGIDVALTVQTDTAIDGAIVLRTVFRADQGTPSLTTYVPRDGTTVTIGRPAATGAGSAAPSISFDNRGTIQVAPGAPALSAAIGSVANRVGADDAAFREAAANDAGISQNATAAVRTVNLTGADLSITHFAGNAFGSAIANTGSDRVIDTQTSVSIDLGAAGPDVLGSTMLRVEGVAIEAARMRVP